MKRSTRTNVRRTVIDNYTYCIDYPSHEIFCKRYPYELKSLYVNKDGRLFFHVTVWYTFHSEDIIPCTKEEAKEFLMSECEVVADFVNFVAGSMPEPPESEVQDDG